MSDSDSSLPGAIDELGESSTGKRGETRRGQKHEYVEETMAFKPGSDSRKIWIVKIPKFLEERWAEVPPNLHLATMRVWNNQDGTPSNPPRIKLILPAIEGANEKSHIDVGIAPYDTSDLPREYDMILLEEAAVAGTKRKRESTFLFEEDRIRKEGRVNPIFSGAIHHEASLKPVLGEEYRKLVKDRVEAAAKPKRTIQRIDEDKMGAGKLNMLSSGVIAPNRKGRFGNNNYMSMSTNKKAGPSDRIVRLPKEQLLDLVFSLFEEYKYWTMAALKERTKQPESWLRENLGQIATLHRNGTYVGTWELLSNYKHSVAKKEEGSDATRIDESVVKDEEKADEDDEEEDDDDMEEV